MVKSNYQIIAFVEGDTEKEFFEALIKYYRINSTNSIHHIKIFNVKGIGRFEARVISKLKHDILINTAGEKISVVCCYDTDVFELAQKPPVNWEIIKRNVLALGIKEFIEVKAKRMLEDWLLKDVNGLCKYLKITPPKKIEGKDGLDKIKRLFKKGNKLYIKGHNSVKFIPSLNISIIRKEVKAELVEFEKTLNVKIG
jgi:hypothetical protein